jgi:hypothetical protein
LSAVEVDVGGDGLVGRRSAGLIRRNEDLRFASVGIDGRRLLSGQTSSHASGLRANIDAFGIGVGGCGARSRVGNLQALCEESDGDGEGRLLRLASGRVWRNRGWRDGDVGVDATKARQTLDTMLGERAFGSVNAHRDAFETRHAGCGCDLLTERVGGELSDHPRAACMRVE